MFSSIDEGLLAYENKSVDLHSIVHLLHKGIWIKNTTVGRVIFNSILPDGVDYVDKIVDKKILTKVINNAYLISGNYQTVLFLDRLKDLGFGMATESGASIAISDVLIPDEKLDILKRAQSEVDDIQKSLIIIYLLMEKDIIRLLMFGLMRQLLWL